MYRSVSLACGSRGGVYVITSVDASNPVASVAGVDPITAQAASGGTTVSTAASSSACALCL